MTTRLFSALSAGENRRVSDLLRSETVGGVLLVIAAAIALIWANSPAADGYFALRDFTIGPSELHLNLSLGTWAADGLLAVFFFLVGLELKRELLVGELKRFSTAIVPVAAAFGGVIAPAVIFAVINSGQATVRGWAIPTATDIAFAVAVLALIGSHLPSALRLFLLTLAVVDDLIAISIIALFYTEEVNFAMLTLALVPLAIYGVLAHRFRAWFERHRLAAWLVLLPLGVLTWALVHESGIHSTIAGVALAFMVPVLDSRRRPGELNGTSLAEEFEHRFRPISVGFAVPVFAFFAAGVSIGGVEGLGNAFASSLGLGIVVALVVGKPLGIAAATALATKLTRAELDPSVRWRDLIGIGTLAGIGFTVSLLIAELSFADGSQEATTAKIGILSASLIAAALAAVVLAPRNRAYKAAARANTSRA